MTRNVAYYDQRTSHGSTLSFVTHAGVLAAIDPESSWERFVVALLSDAGDIQGGTTKEGIHMGVMAGTLDLVQSCYAGAHVRGDVLYFEPRLPSRLGGLSFPMQFRGIPIQVALTADRLTLAISAEGVSGPIRVGASGEVRELYPGERTVFELSRDPTAAGPAARGPAWPWTRGLAAIGEGAPAAEAKATASWSATEEAMAPRWQAMTAHTSTSSAASASAGRLRSAGCERRLPR